ncbi:DUF1801 domain-containing protein [Sphingomonas sp. HF-S3]|uniref:DUF1801 domain-containing protein n=1 Tax=Sphingomonas rustica TaxID=3103142 RepID=A0ABV0B2G1_9SPHN
MDDAVTAKIESLDDWRGAMLAQIRQAILAADPDIVEEIKWRKASNPLGVPTWSRGGILCTGESYKDKVKLTFMKGAALASGTRLFNVPADGVRRAIDLKEGDALDAAALTELIRRASALNLGEA